MGIVGLWETLEPAAEQISFYAFTVTEAAAKKNSEHRSLILGVDMRTVMCECIAATLAAGVHGQFEGGALKIFFNKLCNFRKGAATLIFVLDGERRPEIKRGAQVINREIWWTAQAIELIKNFGFYYYQAPGEAEAELAQLNYRGIIDAVITSDSDTLVFAAPIILRRHSRHISTEFSIPKRSRVKYDDEFVLYTLAGIRSKLSLTLGGLLLFALLSGGDYDKGVYGCGPAVAIGLARCGFGDQLVEAIEKGENMDIFAPHLRDAICAELKENSQGTLGAHHPSLAAQFPDNFPDREILDLYTNPVTSFSCGQTIPSQRNWKTREPSIANIAQFCYDHLGWKTESVLKEKLHSHLWEGVFAQMLFSPLLFYNPESKKLATDNVQTIVLTAARKTRKGQLSEMGPQPRLLISVENFVCLMRRGYTTSNLQKLAVWATDEFLPASVIQKRTGEKRRKLPTIPQTMPEVMDTGDTPSSNAVVNVNVGDGGFTPARNSKNSNGGGGVASMGSLRRKAADIFSPDREMEAPGKRARHNFVDTIAPKGIVKPAKMELQVNEDLPMDDVGLTEGFPMSVGSTSGADPINGSTSSNPFASDGSSVGIVDLTEYEPPGGEDDHIHLTARALSDERVVLGHIDLTAEEPSTGERVSTGFIDLTVDEPSVGNQASQGIIDLTVEEPSAGGQASTGLIDLTGA